MADNSTQYCIPFNGICYVTARPLTLEADKKLIYNPTGRQQACHETVIVCRNQEVFVVITYDTTNLIFPQFVTKIG